MDFLNYFGYIIFGFLIGVYYGFKHGLIAAKDSEQDSSIVNLSLYVENGINFVYDFDNKTFLFQSNSDEEMEQEIHKRYAGKRVVVTPMETNL